jgi:hypothetical protein
MAAVAVTAFVIEAMRNTLSSVMGSGLPTARWPKAPW